MIPSLPRSIPTMLWLTGMLALIPSAHCQQVVDQSPLAGNAARVFVDNTRDRPPRENLTKAFELFGDELSSPHSGQRRRAVDLGAGAGNESLYLLGLGWDVIAIDPEPHAIETIASRALALKESTPGKTIGTIDCRLTTMQDMELKPESVHLINASFSLPYVPADEMDAVWHQCVAALDDGGVFTGHFFGPDHEWHRNQSMSFYSVEELFDHFFRSQPLAIRYLIHTREQVNLAIGGTAFFDTITVIAQKVDPLDKSHRLRNQGTAPSP